MRAIDHAKDVDLWIELFQMKCGLKKLMQF